MDLQVTEDGSHTLFNDLAGQTYHSSHGAVTESNFIFIDAGLGYWLAHNSLSRPIRILEIGFGTGLNAFLTQQYAEKNNLSVGFSSIELYPLKQNVYRILNYGDLLNSKDVFLNIHDSQWDNGYNRISPNFMLRKFNRDIVELLQELTTDKEYHDYFDVIYFDAFSPDSQPELWNQSVFDDLFALSAKNAVLTTYCSKGDVRRAMISSGFNVEKLAGPPGKRHILRAIKN